ncbi:hypothetical protein G7Y89_g9204 [Cudoniella acicularis]|uniref:Uncharacterized protein n=1 Tax=Cudoniella acicularis TaxID=354080 RepID=A0A8H4W2U1_9HELO|nr:hypothetical protein G7Y89_g9204 [Cudoniella acicularis]
MASPKAKPPDEETVPSTPPPRKPSANNTPRRVTAAKRTPNGPRASNNNATTPIRKNSAQNKNRTPSSAPVRTKTGSKKNEPTLLGDFLLGRPSPARQRRKSLDAVKAEIKVQMTANLVGKVQQPGGVKDRVKQWQKANAAAVIEDPLADGASEPEDIGGWENEEDGSVDEEERLRIKFREGKKPNGKRKSKEAEEVTKPPAAAPKKRVISDSHWMKNKKKSPPRKGNPIPKDFLKTTAINPPLEKKIKDWVKRTEGEEVEAEKIKDKPRSRKPSQRVPSDDGIQIKPSQTSSPDDGIRIRPSPANSTNFDDGIRVTPSKRRPKKEQSPKNGSNDDGIRVTPSRAENEDLKVPGDGIRITPSTDAQDDGIRIQPSREGSINDSIRTKSIRRDTSKRQQKEDGERDVQTPRKKSGNHLRVPSESGSNRKPSTRVSSEHSHHTVEDEDKFSFRSPSPPEHSKRRRQKSQTPPESLADIPFGNSAFSVLELPLGAEAGNTLKRPAPKRNGSFGGVPKVLKKVFNEGMKIAHDTVEPPRNGVNQPPSIESWLNGTSDPFVDKPSPPTSTLDVPEPSCSRKPSYKQDDQTEKDLTADHDSERSESRRRRRAASTQERGENREAEDSSPLGVPKTRANLPSMTRSPTSSPTSLKRTPAKRNASSPKTTKKTPLKEAFMDAFRGESTTAHPRSASNPFIDITGLRERDINSTPQQVPAVKPGRDFNYGSEENGHKRSPPASEKEPTVEPKRSRPLSTFERRPPPMTGTHKLSTIASVETFSTSSSATETASEVSQTTVTQDTVYTGPTESSLSRNSQKSKMGLKRRLTKHSDLVSVLSLPDVVEPARGNSIKSARSIRTTRSHLETATVQDLMRELAEDETKYMRELKTLVDGVIPVLLTCVLSKSDSAIASGLFNPDNDSTEDSSITKPIVDMGIALERLKSLHKRIPLADADLFINWANTAHRTYQDYLKAWRAGFQDVVVNLAPASRSSSAEEQLDLDDIPRNKNGDAIGADGQRADVAYFLKRPLVRVKYLAKTTKGLNNLRPSEKGNQTNERFQDLNEMVRRRYKEESARLEDQRANNTDPTRARDPKTLALVEGVKIDRTRQVCARDMFYLDLEHSSGQRFGCRVELFLRDKPDDEGDVLICEMDDVRRFLLFPPISKDLISARLGDRPGQVVVMIRGIQGAEEWSELLILDAEEQKAAAEWVQMLGTEPVPYEIEKEVVNIATLDALVKSVKGWVPKHSYFMSGGLGTDDIQIPIGERVRREAEEAASTPQQHRRRSSRRQSPISDLIPEDIREESVISESVKDLNDAMNKAGSLSISPKRPQASKYHGRSNSRPTTPKDKTSSGSGSEQTTPTQAREDKATTRNVNPFLASMPYIPKIRSSSTPSSPEVSKSSPPLKEPIKQEPELRESRPTTPTTNDGAPPPPAHKTPTTPIALKKAPVLDSPTPRANNRRTSSPLKHEYQPSDASGTSSAEESDSESSGSYSDSSEDEELEAAETPAPGPVPVPVPVYGKRVSPTGSIYSLPNTTLAPSNSASQGPYRSAPVECSPQQMEKHTVMSLSYWNEKGQWIDIYTGPCSMVVGPGWLRTYELDESHSSPRPKSSSKDSQDIDDEPQPLMAQELTPNVFMQRHVIDIHVRSPPMLESKLKCKGTMVRYHMLTPIDCIRLYQALYQSSKNNMTYNRLEEERRVNAYGTNAYDTTVVGSRRGSWFGRKNSYRASARAPSEIISEQSGKSSTSRLSALRSRLSGGNIFNIAKSSVDVAQGRRSGTNSVYSSDASGITPPRTPMSPSLWSGTSTSQMMDLGSENIKIRLYELVTQTRWEDHRYAYLTVTTPPQGRKQNSNLPQGLQKHVIVTRRQHNHSDGHGQILIDEVIGASCFQMVGIKGVMCTVWEDVTGPNGEEGQVGATGRMAGRQRKWLFQMGYVAHANWIFNLLAAGR